MNNVFDDKSRSDLVAYRLQRCKETLREVDYLIDGEFYNAAVSRLYYACYYAVVALLVDNHIETQTHAGVKAAFSLNFVKNNKFDKDLAKTFFQLFDLRHSNDYEDYCFCDKDTIEDIRPAAGIFVAEIEALISKL